MSNKVVDGVELLRMIRDGKFKSGDKIKNELGWRYKYDKTGDSGIFYDIDDGDEMRISEITAHTFEILSENDEEIDIQAIEEIDLYHGLNASEDQNMITNRLKINEVVRAIKQLDNKIK